MSDFAVQTAADRDPIHLAAADWLARLREPEVSLEDTLAWQRWLRESPLHTEAFARMQTLSSVLARMPRPPRPRPSGMTADRYDASVPLSDWRSSRRLSPLLAAAASLMIAAIALAWVMPNSADHAFRTAVGENRTVRLADGSTIVMGGGTKVYVEWSPALRRIDLRRGEAFFTVAKDTQRPFKVRAGGASVVALGTEFNVRRNLDRVVVTVVEGGVMVEPSPRLLPLVMLRQFKPDLAPVRLNAGEATTISNTGIGPAAQVADLTAAVAWQHGQLAFRLQPLREVMEDVNRYAPKKVIIEDERIAALRVTGAVDSRNVSGWIASLENALGIKAVETQDQIILRDTNIP